MLKEIKTSGYEPLYTLTEAEKIIDLQRARVARRRAAKRTYYLIQKFCGLVFIIIGCLFSMVDNTAGTESIICILSGVGLVTTHQMVMMFRR